MCVWAESAKEGKKEGGRRVGTCTWSLSGEHIGVLKQCHQPPENRSTGADSALMARFAL